MVQSRSCNLQMKEEMMYIINKQMWESKKVLITLITSTQNVCFKDWPPITVKNSQNLPLFCAWHVCLIIIMCDLWLLNCQMLSSAYEISTFMLSSAFQLKKQPYNIGGVPFAIWSWFTCYETAQTRPSEPWFWLWLRTKDAYLVKFVE